MQVQPGDVVAGYRILSQVGRGGMGIVYRAVQEVLQREVAVKLIDRSKVSASAVPQIVNEARAAARLRHPHLVAIHDVIDEPHSGALGYAMEYVPGRPSNGLGLLAEVMVSRIMLHIAGALALAHSAGMVHRDVAPGNILVMGGNDGAVAKLLDLGLARERLKAASVPPGPRRLVLLGTPGYISPEQMRDPDNTTPASDVYGLAATAVFWLCGQTAHGGASLIDHAVLAALSAPAMPDNISDAMAELLTECLDPDPSQRPADGAVLVERLRTLTQPRTVNQRVRPRRPARRRNA